jgi:hypothetical protein
VVALEAVEMVVNMVTGDSYNRVGVDLSDFGGAKSLTFCGNNNKSSNFEPAERKLWRQNF